ncbi:hypothetical protein KIN20_005419 [Parelaphostrongylus tenuis]|uniref:Nudix hydrolase domain-containing protein n=1 Tax=Parelaphostrongylus tenuis TaxID=148309 RepID=A0AAD5MSR1_PARTN|nr:hypothetical protein KIN20_005419 [Parelaphostrongylus tenuis]
MVAWRAAASIIVVSRTSRRVLVMRRGATAKFMPNAVVFPGGVVADSDRLLGHPTKELFEETGVILGRQESAATSQELHEMQKKTKADANNFKLVCPSPPLDDLIVWSTWLTPAGYDQRYMTSFFLTECDGEPDIRMCEEEMSHYIWIDPNGCLDKASKGELILPPPQVYELTRISQIIENFRDYGNTRHVLSPQQVKWSDGSRISGLLPGDHLYIDEDIYNQPPRTLSLDAVQVDLSKPTHRVEYRTNPLYADCKLFIHNLKSPYCIDFHQFSTDFEDF